jgi:hypothetical protein
MNSIADLDSLKAAWQQLDQRLAKIEARQSMQHTQASTGRRDAAVVASVRALRPLLVGQTLQALCGAALIVFAAIFWSSNLGRLHLVLSGVSLHAYGVWLLASAGHELSLLAKVRYSSPVLVVQKQLATLRRWRSRNGLVFAYAGCFIWIPAMLIGFATLGADIWVHKPAVVGWFVFSGAVCAAALHLGLRWASSPRNPRIAAALRDNAAGSSLRRAEIALVDIERFEAEGQ